MRQTCCDSQQWQLLYSAANSHHNVIKTHSWYNTSVNSVVQQYRFNVCLKRLEFNVLFILMAFQSDENVHYKSYKSTHVLLQCLNCHILVIVTASVTSSRCWSQQLGQQQWWRLGATLEHHRRALQLGVIQMIIVERVPDLDTSNHHNTPHNTCILLCSKQPHLLCNYSQHL